MNGVNNGAPRPCWNRIALARDQRAFSQDLATGRGHASSHIQIQLGESQGQIQLGIPYSMVGDDGEGGAKREAVRGADLLKNNAAVASLFDEIAVPVIAQWKVKEMRVQDLISLTPGDVLPLDLT